MDPWGPSVKQTAYDLGQPTYVGLANEDAKPCACNTVLYSTLAARAACQGAGLGGIVS